jgi:hypothetical protein
LGQSGATAENRLGFQRLMAEVSLSHAGIIPGMEMSRLGEPMPQRSHRPHYIAVALHPGYPHSGIAASW